MPIDTPTYNRSADFLDTGYRNVPNAPAPVDTRTGAPVAPPVDNRSMASYIFQPDSNLSEKYSFLKSTQFTNPIRTPLIGTERYNDPVFGYDPFNPNLEYQYGDRQSGLQKWKNNLLKFGAGAAGALVESIATIPLVLNGAIEGDTSKIFDNDLTNSISEWLDNMETSLPNYQTTFERDHPVLSYIPGFAGLGTLGDSWGGVIKNLGFTAGSIAGALIQDAGIAALTGGLGEAPLIGPQIMRAFGRFGKVFSGAKSADEFAALTKAALNPTEASGLVFNTGRTTTAAESLVRQRGVVEAIDKAAQTTNLVNKFRYGTALTTSALSESTIEANQTYNTIKEQLTQSFYEKNGRDPNISEKDQIEEYAKAGGNADLYANVPLLIFTEANVLGNVFKPATVARKAVQSEIGRSAEIGLKEGSQDVFAQVEKNAKGFNLIKNKLTQPSRLLRTMGFEGFQEGSQFVIQRTAEDYYKRKFDNPRDTNDFMLSLGTGLRDVFNTREGLENIFMGALAGGLIHVGNRLNEKIRGIDNNRAGIVESSLAWLNNERLSGLFKHTYNEAVASDSIAKDMRYAAQTGDVFEYKNLQFQQLYNFVNSGVKANRFDLRIDQLNSLKEMSQKEFENMFKLPYTDQNRRLASDYVDSVVKKAQGIKDNIDKVNELFINPFSAKSKDIKEAQNYFVFEDYKTQLALDLSEIPENQRRLTQITSNISKIAPLVNQEHLRQLTSEQGLQETVERFNERIEDLTRSEGLYENKNTKEYKAYGKEKSWLTQKIKEINKQLENYDPVTYNKLSEEIINYHLNNGIETKTRISPLDVQTLLNEAKDSAKLINAADRALYHYQHLVTKTGFEDYMAKVNEAHDEAGERFEKSDTGKRILGITAPTEPTESKKDEAAVDKKGNIVSPKTSEQVQSDLEAKKQAAIQNIKPIITNGKTRYTNTEERITADTKEGVIDNITRKYDKLISDLTPEPEMAMSQEEMDKLMAEPETPFSRDVTPAQAEKEQKESYVGKRSTLFRKLDPLEQYNKLFLADKSTLEYSNNLRDALFSQSDKELYNKITLHVQEKVYGIKSDEKFSVPGFKKLSYRGFKHEIQLIADGKILGFLSFPNRHSFKRGSEDIDIPDITPGEYEDITGNDPETYDDFIKDIREYKALTDKILSNYPEKNSYTNEEFKDLFEIIATEYGKVETSGEESTSTFIKDIKSQYKRKGNAIISVPMLQTGERTSEPVIVNEADFEREPEIKEKLQEFIAANIETLRGNKVVGRNGAVLNSRYFYIFQMPNGEYDPRTSIVVARPAQVDKAVLNDVYEVIKSIDKKSKLKEIKTANAFISDALYIASSKDSKGNKVKVSLEFSEGGKFEMKIINTATKERESYPIDTSDLRSFSDVTNKMQSIVKDHRDALAKFRIKIDEASFKNSILQDEDATMEDLEGKLKLSTLPDPFYKPKLFVIPKREKTESAPLSEAEQSLFETIADNVNKIDATYRPGVQQMLTNPRRLVDTIISQFNDNPNAIKGVFGQDIRNAVLPILNAKIATDKKSLIRVLEEFGLPKPQAKATAELYDANAQAWVNRNQGKTKQDYYDRFIFKQGGPVPTGAFNQAEQTQIQKEIAEVRAKAEKNGTLFKAPNGKVSNLSAAQWLVVQTPTFKKWFGNSKAVDANKEPIVFYHGTTAKWEVFDNRVGNRNNGLFLTPEPDFAEDYTKTITLGRGAKEPIFMELYAKVTKPFDYENPQDLKALSKYDKIVYNTLTTLPAVYTSMGHTDNANWAILERPYFQKFLKENNYDGYYVKEQGIKNLAVYNPEQVKDASGKNTTFDASNPNIYFQKTKGAALISTAGQATIYAFKAADVSTFMHELAHTWEDQLTDEEVQEVLEWAETDTWNRDTSEKFARGFEKYLADGNAPNTGLQKIFEQFKKWLTDIYKILVGSDIDIELNDPIRRIYAAMLGENFEAEVKAEVITAPISPSTEETIKVPDVEEKGRNELLIALETPVPVVALDYEKDEQVVYKGKQYKVEEIQPLASGERLYVITDGTKYGSRPVRAEDLTKAEDNTTISENITDEITQRQEEEIAQLLNYKGPKFRRVPVINSVTGLQETETNKEGEEVPVFTDEEIQTRGKDEGNTNLDFVGLKLLLNRLQNRFSIPYKIINESAPWKGRFNKGVVEVNSNNFDRTTPFHEYLHPFIAVMKATNTKLYTNLAKELGASKYGKAVIEDVKNNPFYKDKTAEEIGDEALVRYISKAAAKNVDAKGQRLTNKYYQAMRRLIDQFRKWFADVLNVIGWEGSNIKEMTKKSLKTTTTISTIPETANIQDIADLVALQDVKFDMEAQADLIKALEAFQADIDNLASNEVMMARLKHKIDVLDQTAKKRIPSDVLVDSLIQARSVLKNADALDSLDKYLATGIRGLQYAIDHFKQISGKVKDPEQPITEQDTIEFSHGMGVVKTLIAFYKEDVEYLLHHLYKKLDDEQRAEYNQIIVSADSTINQIQSRTIDILTEWLYPHIQKTNPKGGKYPEYTLSKEKFKKHLWSAGQDMASLSLWLEGISQSKDPVNSVAFIALKGLYEDAHTVYYEMGIKVKLAYDKFLSEKGLANEKTPTEEYFKQNYLRKATIQQKIGEDAEGKPIYDYTSHWAYHEKYLHDLYAKSFREFTESINYDSENEKHQELVNKWVEENTQLDNNQLVPADNYLNPEFEKLYGKDEFFTTIYDFYKEANDQLGEGERLKFGIIPQVSKGKNLFADFQWNQPLQSVKTLGGKVANFFLPQDEQQQEIQEKAKKLNEEKQAKLDKLLTEGLEPDEINRLSAQIEEDYQEKITNLAGNDNVAKNLDGSYYREIHTPYVRFLQDSDLSLALPETILEFYDATNRTIKLRELEPNIALLKSLVESGSKYTKDLRKALKVTSKGNRIFGGKAIAQKEDAKNNLNKQLNHFIDNVVYGDTEDKATMALYFPFLGTRHLDMNKLGSNWAFFNSANVMAGNVTAAISNVVIGEINSYSEALGGKFWKQKHWLQSKGQYAASLPEFFADITRLKKSKITQFGLLFDAIQGEFRDLWGKKIVGSVMQRFANGNSLFFLTQAAEHEIQITSMLSLLNATEVKTTAGETISLYEAFEINKDGYLRVRKNAIWTEQDTKDFSNRLHGINEYLNGLYNQFNKPYIQRKWYGKTAMVFRKHFYNSLKARWGNGYYDRQIQDKISGFYKDFFTKFVSDIKSYKAEAVIRLFTKKGWNSPEEQYAWNRTTFELGLFASVVILATIIARGESDDKEEKPWGQQYLNLLMVRVRGDLGQFNMVGTIPDLVNIVKSPTALVGMLNKFGAFFGQLAFEPFEVYKRKTGYFEKGDSVLFAKFSKLIPFYNQWIKLKTPQEQAQFYTLLHKN